MSNYKEIVDRYKSYPLTYEYVSSWLKEVREDYDFDPKFFEFDWNNYDDLKVKRDEMITIIVFACQFPTTEFRTKISTSSILKPLEKWIVPLSHSEQVVNQFVSKYHMVSKDALLLNIIQYVRISSSSAYFKIITDAFLKADWLQRAQNAYRRFQYGLKQYRIKIKENSVDTKTVFTEVFEELYSKADDEDKFVLLFIRRFLRIEDKREAKRMIRLHLGENKKEILRQMNFTDIPCSSKRELYRDLFILFRNFVKNEEFLSEEDFLEKTLAGKEAIYDTLYSEYMTGRVKTILGLTQKKSLSNDN